MRPGQDREDEEEDERADHRERLLVLARRQVQAVGERRQHHGGDREHQERGDHPRRAALEAQDAVPPAAGDEGEAEDEERVAEDRADQRGLHHGDEPGPEREDADEELGQVADRRLDDAGRGGAEVVAELVGRLADQVGDAGERQRRRREGEERRGAGEVQRAGERHQAAMAAITVSSRRSMARPLFLAPTVWPRGGDCNPPPSDPGGAVLMRLGGWVILGVSIRPPGARVGFLDIDEADAMRAERQALKRRLMPEDVARVALFLISEESGGMTGQCSVVDGGWL